MSLIKICDICGKQVIKNKKYEFIEYSMFSKSERDICYDCVQAIKEHIRQKGICRTIED